MKPDAVIVDNLVSPISFKDLEALAPLLVDVPLVAVICGQTYLPKIISMLCKHLKYRWVLSYDASTHHNSANKIVTHWQPVILFGEPLKEIDDVIRDKTELIEKLTKPGDLIFNHEGYSSLFVEAIKKERRYVSCHEDSNTVEKWEKDFFNDLNKWIDETLKNGSTGKNNITVTKTGKMTAVNFREGRKDSN